VLKSKRNMRWIIFSILFIALIPIVCLKVTTIKGKRFIQNINEISFAEMAKRSGSIEIILAKASPIKNLTDKQSVQKAINIVSDIKLEKINRDKIEKKNSKSYYITFGERASQGYIIAFEDGTFVFEDLKVYETMKEPNACYPAPENLYKSTKNEMNKLKELKELFQVGF
jgi:hypothetical protein